MIGERERQSLWTCFVNACISSRLPIPALQSLPSPTCFPLFLTQVLPIHSSSLRAIAVFGQKSPSSVFWKVSICRENSEVPISRGQHCSSLYSSTEAGYRWYQNQLPGEFSCADFVDGACNYEDRSFIFLPCISLQDFTHPTYSSQCTILSLHLAHCDVIVYASVFSLSKVSTP